ncbi:DUF4249 family protein [Nonlabens sp.]|uniref:DUF4249 family protein n=1 Tax=Nonlabens sp. TaxID=1888209 RepID=UPI003F6A24EB
MKKLFTLLLLVLTITSCEDVIELDLNNTAPRLVIDAELELNEDGTTLATVLLTRSNAFYQEEIITVDDAIVTVTDENGTVFNFNLVALGVYENTSLNIQPGASYTLTIIDGSDIYTATQRFVNTVPYTRVEQNNISGFGDLVEITGFFNDPAGEENYYLFELIDHTTPSNSEIDIIDDEFSDGNEALTVFFIDEEDLPVGSDLTLVIRGIDRRAFTFYDTLIQQTDDGGGGTFNAQPATVRGNIINTTNPEKFPFGYFRVSEVFKIDFTVVANP